MLPLSDMIVIFQQREAKKIETKKEKEPADVCDKLHSSGEKKPWLADENTEGGSN